MIPYGTNAGVGWYKREISSQWHGNLVPLNGFMYIHIRYTEYCTTK